MNPGRKNRLTHFYAGKHMERFPGNCLLCWGNGKIPGFPLHTDCQECCGTGRDTIPWTELYTGMREHWQGIP